MSQRRVAVACADPRMGVTARVVSPPARQCGFPCAGVSEAGPDGEHQASRSRVPLPPHTPQ